MSNPINVKLHSFSYYVPEKIITNEYLSKLLDVSPEWILERSGIEERRYVEPQQATSDISMLALGDMEKKFQTNFAEIDMIIAATLSPDCYFPGISPFIHKKLQLKNKIPCVDLRTQCASFPYVLETAYGYICTDKYKKILIICADIQSKNLNFSPAGRDVTMLFGDGASAFIIEKSDAKPSVLNKEQGLIDNIIYADGNGFEFLNNPQPGTSMVGPIDFTTMKDIDRYPRMDGRAVFKNAVKNLAEVCQEILHKNSLTLDQIDHFVFHQANLRIIENVSNILKINTNKVYNNIQRFGNTTSATVGICLAEASEKNIIKGGDLILCAAFGTGFMWGASLFRM